ncbi:MAG: DUF6134 family protein [Alphaproteobacteria bacterium]|nr:DUF6134 family protein [Alphaproteobacteria bacterium]
MTILAAVAFAIAPARAGAPPGTYEYAVHHSTYGDIGTFTNTVTHKGDEVIVNTRVRIAVKILFIVAHREEADRKEVWRNGQLVSYDSLTQENGKRLAVKGRANGSKFIIEGLDGRIEAPAAVHPPNPWSITITEKTLLLATASGKLLKVKATPVGEETIELPDRKVKARRFKVTGDMDLDLWYDENDVMVRFTYAADGENVMFTLQ